MILFYLEERKVEFEKFKKKKQPEKDSA